MKIFARIRIRKKMRIRNPVYNEHSVAHITNIMMKIQICCAEIFHILGVLGQVFQTSAKVFIAYQPTDQGALVIQSPNRVITCSSKYSLIGMYDKERSAQTIGNISRGSQVSH